MRRGVRARDVVAVVRGDGVDAFFLCQSHQAGVDGLFVLESQVVILNLEEEIVLPEDVAVDAGGA